MHGYTEHNFQVIYVNVMMMMATLQTVKERARHRAVQGDVTQDEKATHHTKKT